LDSLTALSTFARAAEVSSFTRAGQQLGLSSSAIGKTVVRLEGQLGVRLFHRTTRNIRLTEEGRLLLESCRRIISEVRTIEQAFIQTKKAPKGRLRVSLPLFGELLMPILSQFIRTYPDVKLDMDFSDQLVDVVGGGFDAVIHIGDTVDSRLMSRTLGRYRLVIVGAPTYFARAGVPTTPAELAKHACLHYKSLATGKLQRWPFGQTLSDNDPTLPMTASASALAPLVALASLGEGIACLPDFAIRSQIQDGSLVSILNDHIEHTDTVRAVWPSSRFMSPKLRVFITFLADKLFRSMEVAEQNSELLVRSTARRRESSNARQALVCA